MLLTLTNHKSSENHAGTVPKRKQYLSPKQNTMLMNKNLLLCVAALAASTVQAVSTDTGSWESPYVSWDESLDAYVPWPDSVAHLLEKERPNKKYDTPVALYVIGSVSDWDLSLWSLLKGMDARTPVRIFGHYVIDDGATVGCRQVDPDEPAAMKEVVSAECSAMCTNHGRYCATSDDVQSGAAMVAESLRRSCIGGIDAKKRLWRYLEAFTKQNCREAKNLTDCSMQAIEAIPDFSYQQVEECVQYLGGLDDDKDNLVLKINLLQQQRNHYDHECLPLLEINDQVYHGEHNVKDIFQAVCQAFPANKTPLACDVCSACGDVRKCLWHLQCDGKQFDTKAYLEPELA
jgi:hypothetical protein